jgi:hypothetical protein
VLDVPEGGNLPCLTESFHKFRALVSLGKTVNFFSDTPCSDVTLSARAQRAG